MAAPEDYAASLFQIEPQKYLDAFQSLIRKLAIKPEYFVGEIPKILDFYDALVLLKSDVNTDSHLYQLYESHKDEPSIQIQKGDAFVIDLKVAEALVYFVNCLLEKYYPKIFKYMQSNNKLKIVSKSDLIIDDNSFLLNYVETMVNDFSLQIDDLNRRQVAQSGGAREHRKKVLSLIKRLDSKNNKKLKGHLKKIDVAVKSNKLKADVYEDVHNRLRKAMKRINK